MDDASLIARVVLNDDRRAFAELVRRHQSAVRVFLRRLTGGDHALADDLAQETFITAYRELRRFEQRSSLQSWLLGIALNRYRTDARRARHRFEEPLAPANQGAETAPSPEARAQQQQVIAALDRLPLPERAALCLCSAMGLSHREAADIMEVPLGTVKTHVLRGKERLRAFLDLAVVAAGEAP